MLKEKEQHVNVGTTHPSGAKALSYLRALAARLKSCPVTKPVSDRVFPQAVLSLAADFPERRFSPLRQEFLQSHHNFPRKVASALTAECLTNDPGHPHWS